MGKSSAGLLLYRIRESTIEVLLVHPSGTYWKNKDEGAWSIPKGGFLPGEGAVVAARREFFEETGVAVEGKLYALKPLRQPGGKIVHAWAVEGDLDPATIVSNKFEFEWPPRSGRLQSFPEIDRGACFALREATRKILRGQVPLLEVSCVPVFLRSNSTDSSYAPGDRGPAVCAFAHIRHASSRSFLLTGTARAGPAQPPDALHQHADHGLISGRRERLLVLDPIASHSASRLDFLVYLRPETWLNALIILVLLSGVEPPTY